MHQMATFMFNIVYGPSTSKYELNYIYSISEVIFALLKIYTDIIYFLYCQEWAWKIICNEDNSSSKPL